MSKIELIESLIRPHIREMARSFHVSDEEWATMPMNSHERNFLRPLISNEALLKEAKFCMDNVTASKYPTTYEEAIVTLLFPLVCERLKQAMDK